MDISIMIEGQMGLNWPRWTRVAAEVERLGFAGLFRSDHFVNPRAPEQDSLEMVASLTYLADRTERIHFGPLVAPASFRDPVMLARQAAALGDLSGGRFVLGLGAGWMEREHEMFGYELGDIATRFARFEEALEVCTLLLRGDGPVTFEGRFYRLCEASILPRPVPAPKILVGGGGPKRTLPLAARFADVWNGTYLAPDVFRERRARLDGLLAERGRKPSDVKGTMMTGFYPDGDDGLRARGALTGPLETIPEQLVRLQEAGVEELMIQWFALDDLEGLRLLSAAVL